MSHAVFGIVCTAHIIKLFITRSFFYLLHPLLEKLQDDLVIRIVLAREFAHFLVVGVNGFELVALNVS